MKKTLWKTTALAAFCLAGSAAMYLITEVSLWEALVLAGVAVATGFLSAWLRGFSLTKILQPPPEGRHARGHAETKDPPV